MDTTSDSQRQRADMFILSNNKFLQAHLIPQVREKLMTVDDSKWIAIQSIQFKDPTTSLIVSLFAGTLGVDRFMIGDTGMGVGKLLTCGGFGIWAVIDWFMIQDATKEKNMQLLMRYLY